MKGIGVIREVTATSPGRICFAGESLDWMIGGPSIVGAIDLNAQVSVANHNDSAFIIRSGEPFSSEISVNPDKIASYDNHPLAYIQAAIKVLLDAGIPLQPFALEASTLLPTKAGVSSSAAVSLATIAAVSHAFGAELKPEDLCALSYKVEDEELKTGAGQMDFYACGLGGLQYMNCSTQPPHLEKYTTPATSVILVDTLTPHSTKKFVSSKRQRFQDGEPKIVKYAEEAPIIVEKMRSLLKNFDANIEEIGFLVTLCHTYLRDLVQSSTPLLDLVVETSLSHGAYGAKLTGTGLGGCMFALCPEEKIEELAAQLNKLPVKVYQTKMTGKGVTISSN